MLFDKQLADKTRPIDKRLVELAHSCQWADEFDSQHIRICNI
jgi:hypothetical protein